MHKTHGVVSGLDTSVEAAVTGPCIPEYIVVIITAHVVSSLY